MPLDLPIRTPTEEEIEMDKMELEKIAEQRHLETQINAHLWGYLKPYNMEYAQIDFWRLKCIYKLGRLGDDSIDISIPGRKLSSLHCTLRWDGKEGLNSQVIVFDHSLNGTYINGSKIGKGRCAVLRDYDILSLASPEHIRYPSGEIEDFRFQFHHMAVRTARAAIDALYTKQYHLGSGAFGEVWKGLDHTHNRIVAIKTVNVRGQGEQTQSKKLKAIAQEITIMERLAHPNVCELFQFYYDQPAREIHIIMEFIEGGDLYKFIVKNPTISEWLGRHLTYEICSGLGYLHINGISHRDIKPENVLLTLEDPPRAKISDFGLSKNFSDMSHLQSQVGTLFYMAPEFFESDPTASYTYLVDSWAVGVLVYAMFTKQFPWNADSNQKQEQGPEPQGGAERPKIPAPILCLRLDKPPFTTLPSLCQHFIQRLMDTSTKTRMSINAAPKHAWLADWVPIYDNRPYPRSDGMRRGQSWVEALEELGREAEAAEREEMGLGFIEEEDEEMEDEEEENTVAEEEIEEEVRKKRTVRVKNTGKQDQAKSQTEFEKRTTRSMTHKTREKNSTMDKIALPRKLTRKNTPYPPGYLP